MEQRSFLLSALGVGVGVGVGIGLASGQSVGNLFGSNNSNLDCISVDQIELELLRLIVNGIDTNVTFDDFPYYLSEQTRVLLTSAAYVHLKHAEVSKFTRNLSPGSRAILVSGPAELYQQMLAKALAHHFDAKLLLLDVTDFSIKMQNKYGCNRKEPGLKRSISEATLGRMSSLLGSISMLPPKDLPRGTLRRQVSTTDINRAEDAGINPAKHRRNASTSTDLSSIASASASSGLTFY